MLCAGTVENVNKNAFEASRSVSSGPDTHMDEDMHMSVNTQFMSQYCIHLHPNHFEQVLNCGYAADVIDRFQWHLRTD